MNSKKRKAAESLKPIFSTDKLAKTSNNNDTSSSLTHSYNRRLIQSDGNCLFQAISYSLYRYESKYAEIRKEVCKYMFEHRSDLMLL